MAFSKGLTVYYSRVRGKQHKEDMGQKKYPSTSALEGSGIGIQKLNVAPDWSNHYLRDQGSVIASMFECVCLVCGQTFDSQN